MRTILTASGATKPLPDNLEAERVAGLDPAGRIVVDDYDARSKPYVARPAGFHGYLAEPFMFALTLCCNASDKGVEDGVVCRGCYGYEETGDYLFKQADGSFPGLDPLKEIR